MCGINGIWNWPDKQHAAKMVAMMNAKLAHRGPDNSGVFSDEKVALGHQRLSIIDVSNAGNQPMVSDDGRYQIVYNGELYNFRELKAQIQNYPFKTNTDTEVVLAAYSKWGIECLSRFNGMFAFAIYDLNKAELLLARDRLGIKPLYYFTQENVIAFSSEVRALLQSGLIPRKINPQGLSEYLKYQTVHAPNTIIEGVKMLESGQYLRINDSGKKLEKYWSFSAQSLNENSTQIDDVHKKVKDLLYASVERRMMADVPYGAFLSGGVDSSAIVGIMSEVTSKKVNTFSVTFDEDQFSESSYAQLVASKFNTNHEEIRLKPNDFLELLPEALSALDHPSGDGPNTYVVSKVTKEAGITMALSGLGGDEVFAGYPIFNRALRLDTLKWINYVPQVLRAGAGKIINTVVPSIETAKLAEILSSYKIDFVNTCLISRQVYLNVEVEKMLGGTVPCHPEKWMNNNALFKQGVMPKLSQVSVAEMETYMKNILLRDTDQMSMAHALEVRVPFLDHELVEYAMAIPDQIKKPITPKKLLVDSLGSLIPEEVWNRPKMGFTFPWSEWLKQELKKYAETRLIALGSRTYFNKLEIQKLWNDFINGKPHVNWSRIWILVVLEDWMQTNNIQ